jgi:hypothetical protein
MSEVKSRYSYHKTLLWHFAKARLACALLSSRYPGYRQELGGYTIGSFFTLLLLTYCLEEKA